jgi:tetratricopeptide (TPR) repeat protein
MKIGKKLIILASIIACILACNTTKKIAIEKDKAVSSYNNQQYAQAYTQFSELIKKYKKNNLQFPYDIYIKAAESALQLEKYSVASEFYEQALRDSVSVIALKGNINALRKAGDYSKVFTTIENFSPYLKENKEESYLNEQRFLHAVDTKNKEKIVSIFTSLQSPTEKQALAYIISLEELDRKKEAVLFSNDWIKNNPTHFSIKEWSAVYYYDSAEAWYKSEMQKYNENKNYTAYVYLKRELKKISSRYRISKDLFEELHNADKNNEKYIRYLKNIYLRLEMKSKAIAMDKLLK